MLPQAKIGPGDMPTATVVTLDAVQEWIVAVSRSTGDAFGLYGFEMTGEAEPTASFNKLVARFHVKITDRRTAEELATVFYLSVADPRGHNLMTNWLTLRLRAEEYAYAKYDEPIAERLFSTWWKGFNTAAVRPPIAVSVRKSGERYSVALPVFRVSEKRDVAVINRIVLVNADGTCRFQAEDTVFRYPMRDRASAKRLRRAVDALPVG